MIGSVNCSSGGTDSRVDELFDEHNVTLTISSQYESYVMINGTQYFIGTHTLKASKINRLFMTAFVGNGAAYLNGVFVSSMVFCHLFPAEITSITVSFTSGETIPELNITTS